MTALPENAKELQEICPGAQAIKEGDILYFYLPQLTFPAAGAAVAMDVLLCPQARDNYATRLFLSEQIQGKALGWSAHQIAGRTWYTWSWKDVSADGSPLQILMGHLRALK